MNGKSINHVLLAVLGILVLLLNTSPTLADSNGMTKQDLVNFIGGRPINFDAMYHGFSDTAHLNIWTTPFSAAATTTISSGGKMWLVGITCNKPTAYNPCVGYRDQTLNQVVTSVPNDVFTTATNALAPYLTTTYIAPKPTPIPYITPKPTPIPDTTPTQQKTKLDLVNFIGRRPINFGAMYHGFSDTSNPNIWTTPFSATATMTINSAGKWWLVGLNCGIPTTYNPCVGYRDQTLNKVVTSIPNDVFVTATNALAPYLS